MNYDLIDKRNFDIHLDLVLRQVKSKCAINFVLILKAVKKVCELIWVHDSLLPKHPVTSHHRESGHKCTYSKAREKLTTGGDNCFVKKCHYRIFSNWRPRSSTFQPPELGGLLFFNPRKNFQIWLRSNKFAVFPLK
jgi:hypothetical protein